MIVWLVDAYRSKNEIILWVKTADGQNIRLPYTFSSFIYAGLEAIPSLNLHSIPFKIVKKRTYRNARFVLEIALPYLHLFEYFLTKLERITRHRVTFYNADIKPEQMFLYQNGLCPFTWINIQDTTFSPVSGNKNMTLRELFLDVLPSREVNEKFDVPIRMITFNGRELKGAEEKILREFAILFKDYDPDVITMHRAYAFIPYLMHRLKAHDIVCDFHRWDPTPLQYRGGRSYWSYNQVRYQDYSISLHGRLLIDKTTFVGSECDVDGIIEMVRLSGTLFQPTVARSFGAVFQSALVRLMIQENMIVPFKEKPIEPPLSMFHMLKADRGGLIIDPKVGFHQNVAELDFTSMFPWLIYNHNISAECILSDEGPFEDIPGFAGSVVTQAKGSYPSSIKTFYRSTYVL